MCSPFLFFVVFSLKNKQEVNTNICRETRTKHYFHHTLEREEKTETKENIREVGYNHLFVVICKQ